ncbi:DUF2793 domain-containing protein [Sulfitobacter pontiacus]
MAGERQLPGLGLHGFWTLGSNGYKTQMDENMRKLSALVQPTVKSILAAEPSSPANGDIHVASSAWSGVAAAQSLVLRDNGAWVAVTPQVGWTVYDKATGKEFRYSGVAWLDQTVNVPNPNMVQSEITGDTTLTNTHLSGNRVVRVSSATDIVVTINSGLTGTEPVTFIRKGVGKVTFASGSGVTLWAAGDLRTLRAQYSSAVIVPDASAANGFYILGDLG